MNEEDTPMIVRNISALEGSPNHVKQPNWASTRMIVAADEMRFSLHLTRIYEGQTGLTEYPNHLEAAYCIEGHATLIYEGESKTDEIIPGTVYALDRHDPHKMVVHKELVLLCVFSPPLHGGENANVQ